MSKFKVGDSVRITLPEWESRTGTVSSVPDDSNVVIVHYDEPVFTICGGLFVESELEMVEEKLTPEKGDRVRLVHENGDIAEVMVSRIDGIYLVAGDNAFWIREDGWSVAEILPKPAPTEPQGLGAVVEYEFKESGSTYQTVRVGDAQDSWYEDGDIYDWSDLLRMAKPGTIKVLSEGYTPVASE